MPVFRLLRLLFLSTPSARRATFATSRIMTDEQFLSTPSARRATHRSGLHRTEGSISIHALREEGDDLTSGFSLCVCQFLSTPSARRATAQPKRVLHSG